MTKLFTEEEVIKLCNAIRSHPSLYNPADANFGKSLPNRAIWDTIAQGFEHKRFTGKLLFNLLSVFLDLKRPN